MPGDARVMEAKNDSRQPVLSAEDKPLEVMAEGIVLASRSGRSGAVIDEVNIVNWVGDKFKFVSSSVCGVFAAAAVSAAAAASGSSGTNNNSTSSTNSSSRSTIGGSRNSRSSSSSNSTAATLAARLQAMWQTGKVEDIRKKTFGNGTAYVAEREERFKCLVGQPWVLCTLFTSRDSSYRYRGLSHKLLAPCP